MSWIGPSSANATRSPAAARSAATSAGACADTASASPPATRAAVGDVERPAAEVNAVRAHGQRDVDPVVDVQRDARRRGRRAQRAGQLGQRAAGQILLAELHRDRAGRQAAARDAAQGGGHDVGQRAPAVACRSVIRYSRGTWRIATTSSVDATQ